MKVFHEIGEERAKQGIKLIEKRRWKKLKEEYTIWELASLLTSTMFSITSKENIFTDYATVQLYITKT